MSRLTAHCLVKNEENYVYYAIKSVVNFVDQVIVFDTGSTDKTVDLIKQLAIECPGKIIFEEKGPCDKVRHTKLRQEMLALTKTDWIMVLDGDEVWTERGMKEILGLITSNITVSCIVAPYYLCVGDVLHYSNRGKYTYDKVTTNALARFFRITPGVAWSSGSYGEGDYVADEGGNLVRTNNYIISKEKYWHATALERSSKDADVTLGRSKQVMTYSLKIANEGFKIKEPLPEVFAHRKDLALPLIKSWTNAILLVLFGLRILKKRIWI